MIDPPSGWKYGFPKELPKDIQEPEGINDWLISEGYPKKIIDDLGEYFHYRVFETDENKPKIITKKNQKMNKELIGKDHNETAKNEERYSNGKLLEEFSAPFKEMPFKKPLKSLEQHNAERMQSIPRWGMNKEYNGIACPDCGEELYDSNPMVTLASLPAQKNIHCDNCNYSGYRIA